MEKISYQGELWIIVTIFERENGKMYYVLESVDGGVRTIVSKQEVLDNP